MWVNLNRTSENDPNRALFWVFSYHFTSLFMFLVLTSFFPSTQKSVYLASFFPVKSNVCLFAAFWRVSPSISIFPSNQEFVYFQPFDEFFLLWIWTKSNVTYPSGRTKKTQHVNLNRMNWIGAYWIFGPYRTLPAKCTQSCELETNRACEFVNLNIRRKPSQDFTLLGKHLPTFFSHVPKVSRRCASKLVVVWG